MVFANDNMSEDYDVQKRVKLLKDKGFSPKDISVILSELYGCNKNNVYKISIGK